MQGCNVNEIYHNYKQVYGKPVADQETKVDDGFNCNIIDLYNCWKYYNQVNVNIFRRHEYAFAMKHTLKLHTHCSFISSLL